MHLEIHASEPQALIDFYGQLLGWTFTQFGVTPYCSIDTGDGAIGLNAPGNGINGGSRSVRARHPSAAGT